MLPARSLRTVLWWLPLGSQPVKDINVLKSGTAEIGNVEYWEEPFRFADKSGSDKVGRTYLHNLLQFHVFNLGLFQEGNVLVGVYPERDAFSHCRRFISQRYRLA